MRGSGSHDVMINGHVVPEAAIAMRRLAGEWHPVFHIIANHCASADLRRLCRRRRRGARRGGRAGPAQGLCVHDRAGRADGDRTPGRATCPSRYVWRHLPENAPSAESVNQVDEGRSLVARHALAVGELALEASGGAGFYRKAGVEQRFRDLQVRAFIRCKRVRKRTMLDGWRSASPGRSSILGGRGNRVVRLERYWRA